MTPGSMVTSTMGFLRRSGSYIAVLSGTAKVAARWACGCGWASWHPHETRASSDFSAASTSIRTRPSSACPVTTAQCTSSLLRTRKGISSPGRFPGRNALAAASPQAEPASHPAGLLPGRSFDSLKTSADCLILKQWQHHFLLCPSWNMPTGDAGTRS